KWSPKLTVNFTEICKPLKIESNPKFLAVKKIVYSNF
ncbi:hypothetical protein LEP1GSC124_1200, partial [Leptospira interrogans serovar Pyrogenes str. 200701872]